MKSGRIAVLIALLAMFASHSAIAANADGFSRDKGFIVRVGAGAPANFNVGAGFRFNPHLTLTGEVFSYSGLTTLTGVIDARYYVLDNGFTPFVATRIGYGTLGKTLEYSNYKDNLGSIIAGLSWRRFDVGAGIIYDSFHKTEFTANLSWTFR